MNGELYTIYPINILLTFINYDNNEQLIKQICLCFLIDIELYSSCMQLDSFWFPVNS